MGFERKPLTDELKEILSGCILSQEARQRIQAICDKLAELEFASTRSDAADSFPKEAQWHLVSLATDHRVQTILSWLSSRGAESVTAIAFGTQLSNEVAGECLEKLRAARFVEHSVQQIKPDKWCITELGLGHLSRQHDEANS